VRSVLGREAIVWERSAGAAALTGGAELRTDARAVQTEATRRLPGAVISVGVGRVQPDPLELRLSYSEALRSLQVGRRCGGQGTVSLFADLGLDRLLLSCAAAELEAFFTATLDPMLSYERAHPGCGLTETLEAFLGANRNVAETARVLFVHYNTVKYRLERLERLLGAFVDLPERCLTLEVATHIRALITRSPL
jgi:PucR family transcriptional regulator, purine catabolism regulatory protein